MVSIVKVDQIKSSDGTTEYLNAGNIKNATLDSTVTGGSGINALGTVASGTFNGTLGSSATFPAGHVIGVYTDTFNITSGSVDILSSGTLWTGLDVTVPATSTDNTIIVQVHIAGLSNKGVTGRSALLGLKYSIDDWGNTLTLGPDALIVQPTVYSGGGVLRDSVSFQLPVAVPTTSSFRIRTHITGQNGDIEIHAATNGVSSMVVWLIKG